MKTVVLVVSQSLSVRVAISRSSGTGNRTAEVKFVMAIGRARSATTAILHHEMSVADATLERMGLQE